MGIKILKYKKYETKILFSAAFFSCVCIRYAVKIFLAVVCGYEYNT